MAVVIGSVPPLAIVFLRVSIAAITLWCLCALVGIAIPRSGRLWRAFSVMAILNNVIPFSLIVYGQQDVGAALAAILNATTPFLTVLVAGACLPDEPWTFNLIVGSLIGFIGVALVIDSNGWLPGGGPLTAELAILGAALSYACAGIYGRRFRLMAVAPVAVATGQVTVSSVILLALMAVTGTALRSLAAGATVWLALLGLGALSTGVAYVVYFRLLARVGATNLLLVTFLIPVVATGLGVLVLGESLDVHDYVGIGFIGVGLLTIDGRFSLAVLPRL